LEAEYFPKIPVGNTPFFQVPRLCVDKGYANIWIKNDGLNPSGSLKDRASWLMVGEAKRLKEKTLVAASTGNAGSALAAICAAEGLKAKLFVPASAPQAKLLQSRLYGADLTEVQGTYDDAFRLSLEYSEKVGGLNRNTAYHPLTIEGKKTAGLEIYVQNQFKVPDYIFVPVGDGVIISGIWKAFHDLKMSKLTDKLPRLIAVQAEKSNAIAHYVKTGKYLDAENPDTVADSISVRCPSNAHLAKKAIEDSKGFALTVCDNEIRYAQKKLASRTGVFAEPAASAAFAGLEKCIKEDKIKTSDQIVLLITGHGLKDVEAVKL
ncbi:threonine synthase, partial [bacterium]|nr:threonine synthase [bacterium]